MFESFGRSGKFAEWDEDNILSRVRAIQEKMGFYSAPVDIDRFAYELGVKRLVGVHTASDGHIALSDTGEFNICYRVDRPHQRVRFTIAHEIGHILLAKFSGMPLTRRASNPTSEYKEERLANRIAAELLMPKKEFLRCFLERRYSQNAVRRTIAELRPSGLLVGPPRPVRRAWPGRPAGPVRPAGFRLVRGSTPVKGKWAGASPPGSSVVIKGHLAVSERPGGTPATTARSAARRRSSGCGARASPGWCRSCPPRTTCTPTTSSRDLDPHPVRPHDDAPVVLGELYAQLRSGWRWGSGSSSTRRSSATG